MANNYNAPYQLSARMLSVPSGQFTVPVCTTPERFDKIMNALWYYGQQQDNEFDFDHLIDWLAACNNIVEGCVASNPVCRTISPTSEMITWFPENPYHPDEEIPSGYDHHPWTVADTSFLGLITWGLGYKVGDVFTDLSKSPDITDWENINSEYLNMPSVFIDNLHGAGTIKAHLLSIPFGGRIIIIVDENPVDLLNLVSVEMDRDSLTFPPETAVELVIETEITGDGDHSIRYVWYPVIEVDLPPIAFGGGVRSFELCGFGVTTMPDENCCDDQLVLINKTNLLLDAILTIMRNGFKIVPITDGQTDSISFGGCLPDQFDEDSDDTGDDIQKRKDVLCWVVQAYLYSILFENLSLIGVPLGTVTSVWAYASNNPFPLAKLQVNGNFLTWIVFAENVATFGTVIDLFTCQMLASLEGKSTSYAVFRDSIPDSENPNPFVSAIYHMIYYANHQKDNYTLFCDALMNQFDAGVPSGWTCPCAPEAPIAEDCNDISLVDVEGTGCQIEYMGECVWKFTQPNVSLMAGISARHFSFRDANGLHLLVTVPAETTVYPVTAVGGCEIDGVCASPDYHGYMFGGGFAPYELAKVMWWQGEAASNVTYYRVELASC